VMSSFGAANRNYGRHRYSPYDGGLSLLFGQIIVRQTNSSLPNLAATLPRQCARRAIIALRGASS
jgi:hypothetical protein